MSGATNTAPPSLGMPNAQLAVGLLLAAEASYFMSLVAAYLVFAFSDQAVTAPSRLLLRIIVGSFVIHLCLGAAISKAFARRSQRPGPAMRWFWWGTMLLGASVASFIALAHALR